MLMVRRRRARTAKIAAEVTLHSMAGLVPLSRWSASGSGKGLSVGAKALFNRLANVAEQARVAKVWKAANEKP